MLVVGLQQRLLVVLVDDADRHHVVSGHLRLLRLDALIPRPDEALLLALVEHREGEPVVRLARLGQRQRDPANILLVGPSPLKLPGSRRLPHQLADRLAVLDQVGRAAGAVLEGDACGVDAEVVVDRRGDVLRADRPVDDVLAARSLLRPITWPIRIRPQPIRTLKVLPQWSRPASLFIRGVRPNSPIATTSVES